MEEMFEATFLGLLCAALLLVMCPSAAMKLTAPFLESMAEATYREFEKKNGSLLRRHMGGRTVMQIAFQGGMTDEQFAKTCEAFRKAANMPSYIKRPYSLMINTEGVGFSDLSLSRVNAFKDVYRDIYAGLEANVDTTIVNLKSRFLRTAYNTIIALKGGKTATEVKMHSTWAACEADAQSSSS